MPFGMPNIGKYQQFGMGQPRRNNWFQKDQPLPEIEGGTHTIKGSGPSWTDYIGPAIGAAASIGSTLIQSKTQERSTEKSNQARKEEAELAFEREKEMWRMQNEYNSPAAQQRRFREAGLNPHLMYGQGTPGLAQDRPSYQAAPQQFQYAPEIDPLAAVSGYLDFDQQQTGIKYTDQQTKVQKAQRTLTMAREAGILTDNTIKSVEMQIASLISHSPTADLEQIAKARIGGMKATEWLKVATAEIRQWEKRLTDANISPRDAIQWRYLVDLLESIGFSPEMIRNSLPNIPSKIERRKDGHLYFKKRGQ